MTWSILLVLLLLAAALPLYFLGQTLYLRRQYQKKEEADACFFHQIEHQLLPSASPDARRIALASHQPLAAYAELMQYIERETHFPLTWNRAPLILNNGEAFFPMLMAEIDRARHHVHLLFYTIRDDRLAAELLDKLEEKAEDGVEVRLLVDGVGSRALIHSRRFQRLREKGVQASIFLPLKLGLLPAINFRNHRKIAVIDGRTAFTGGLNVGDEYLHRDAEKGFWRDIQVKVEGEAVHYLQRIFATDWYYSTGELLAAGALYFPPPLVSGEQERIVWAHVVPSGPDMSHPFAREIFVQAIRSASQRIWLGTPYFVPDQELVQALKQAATRGIEVKLIIPERTDNPLAYYASFHFLKQLLGAGVKVYLYQKGFYHAKVVLVDKAIVNIGSTNLDQRSFRLSFETGLFIYDGQLAQQLADIYLQDLKECRLLLPEALERRSFWAKTATQLSLVVAPWL